jgi:hypothetical protein
MTSTTKATPMRPPRVPRLAIALIAVMLVLARQHVHANDEVPFAASFTTQFESVVIFPIVTISVSGSGQARHLGATTAVTNDQVHNLLTGAASATYTLTGANGDTVVLALDFQAATVQGAVTFAGTYIVTGGTGRFTGATGSGSISGSAMFQGPTSGVGSFEVHGTLTSPAGDRASDQAQCQE